MKQSDQWIKNYLNDGETINENKSSDDIINEIIKILGKSGWGSTKKDNLVEKIKTIINDFKIMDDNQKKILQILTKR